MSKIIENEPGQKLDIGGIELYYELLGKNNEGPTLVFDSGYGFTLETWNSIKDDISKFSKMFIYDRAGIGKSEWDNRPRHSQQSVENLRALLKKASVNPPYVLVGHSFGGLNVRLFASTYPEEVAGVVLLDSCHEDQNKILPSLFTKEVQEDYYNQFTLEGSLNEVEESLEQARTSKSLGNIPLIVVTGGLQPFHTTESMIAWMKFQGELANLSTNKKHIIVEDAGHAIHIDRPQIVINVIKDILDMIKNNKR
ncbi:alpha/beta fold hydrolase [Aneurinibacillus migulanus]|uniref:2-hydroxy-6-oxononatrienedioate hydrolase n=1 Tax=Aneurinibacillus migulanus TaxID=47500 RepID=A0A0D1YN82_ANEMI|nr:alpha/beta hydrolase [Aneurinibacillus migulanus]KIV60097.1 2-hydroxy-6-oxononatrienedioate hydrolase [Aneurinibacillus migulanus]KON96786.1 2-hydroxy-6-oxononatrienedioate hydrolase [Aneurinibacillus migulanus]MED0893554.1 alpha/beta hydrolase [Aneurinibacillus migulanus]MED1616344.1 alpha/beta hydrolase [Aneurinibacillus migulanus]SDJ45556.1 Pimeloyl-ACP methyl ester carboxylesterase [Aneurinibacillus migulanus]